MKRIVLFASGSGSNVEAIAGYFKESSEITIAAVFTNKKDAYVLSRCDKLEIPAFYFNNAAFQKSSAVLDFLKCLQPDLIVLAGFLLKVPGVIIQAFPDRIINIHPALLPKFGGKGMYGKHVHAAVKDKGESETGITIHFVNEQYDEGAVIKQFKVALSKTDSVEDIAKKVQVLEHRFFPQVIETILRQN